MMPIDAACFGVAAQSVGDYRIAQIANHRRERGSNRRRTLIEILLDATHEIIAERLDELRLLRRTDRRYVARILTARHRVEQSDRVASGGATRDLARSQKRRVIGCVGERRIVADVADQLGWTADAG